MTDAPTRPASGLADMLAANLGDERARELVDETVSALGLNGAALSQEEALDVLERLAQQPGIVGITCRFAKSRIHLNWDPGR
jgi:hypothetical protein